MVIPRMNFHRFLTFGLLLGGLALGGLTAVALTPEEAPALQPPLRLIAYAIDLGTSDLPKRHRSGTVEIAIERWSSVEERDSLIDTLRTRGAENLLTSLQNTPRVGYIRTPDSIGWDLHYASDRPTADGGRRIFIATDRPIRFWETWRFSRTLHYPFTLIEIRLDPQGKGEGKMSVATKVTLSADGKTIELENYSTQPVLLEEVSIDRR